MSHSAAHGRLDALGAECLVADHDAAGVGAAGAEHHVEQRRSARSQQTGYADDLSGADTQAQVTQRADRHVLDLEHRRSYGRRTCPAPSRGRREPSRAGDQRDDVVLRCVAGQGSSDLAVAVDGDLVGDRADLLEAMADERDRLTDRRALPQGRQQRL